MSSFFPNRIIQSSEHSFFIKLGPNQNQNDPSRLTRRKREAISPNNKRFYRVWPPIHLRRVTCRGDQLLPQYETKCCWSYPIYAYEIGAFSETRSSGPKFGPVDDKPSSSLLLRFFANRITQSRKISKFVFVSENQRQIIFYAFLPMSLTIWLQIYISGYSSQNVDYSKFFFRKSDHSVLRNLSTRFSCFGIKHSNAWIRGGWQSHDDFDISRQGGGVWVQKSG